MARPVNDRDRWRGEDDTTVDMDDQNLLQHQQRVFDRQDDHLDEMLKGMRSLKEVGTDINTELHVHGALLSDIDDKADRVSGKLASNTHRVTRVTEKSSSWAGCITMVLLAALIVLLIII